MTILYGDDFKKGVADRRIPLVSLAFNAARGKLTKLFDKAFQITSAYHGFMSTAPITLTHPYDFYPDGGNFRLLADFQMGSAFNDLAHARIPRRFWTMKMEVHPLYMQILPKIINDEAELVPSLGPVGHETYIVREDMTRKEVESIMMEWQNPDVTPQKIMRMFQKNQEIISNRELTDNASANHIISKLGPMVPEADRLARFKVVEGLGDFYADALHEERRKHEMDRRLNAYTRVGDSEVIPQHSRLAFDVFRTGKQPLSSNFVDRAKGPKLGFVSEKLGWGVGFFPVKQEQGLFARNDIPEGTWLGEYLGDKYSAEQDRITHVFTPEGATGADKFDTVGRDGSNLLRYSNDAPGNDMTLPDGTVIKAANVRFDGYHAYVAEDIKAGTELTWNYQGEEWALYDQKTALRSLNLTSRKSLLGSLQPIANLGVFPA